MLSWNFFDQICWVYLNPADHKIFGFSEFLTGLALMALVWTIVDIRFRFRISTAIIPLERFSFIFISAIGFLTLLTDIWRAEGWLVPCGDILTPVIWQAILGGSLFLVFLSWIWFSLIKPPTYGVLNAKRFANTLYRYILKGSPIDLPIIADEVVRSLPSLIKYGVIARGPAKQIEKPSLTSLYANDLLLLIADKKFCRAITGSSQATALVLFQELKRTKKYKLPIETFSKNIMSEAYANRDSFLYHEIEGYESGFIGYTKPLTEAIFGEYIMVEEIGSLLDPDIDQSQKWDSAQLDAYCRVVLMVVKGYARGYLYSHSFCLARAFMTIQHSISDAYTLNEAETLTWNDDRLGRVRVVIAFIEKLIQILDEACIPEDMKGIKKNSLSPGRDNFYDYVAKLIFEILFSVSAVKAPASTAWHIQYSTVWGSLFGFNRFEGAAGRLLKKKLDRLIYDEIAGLKKFPNFKGARFLRYCLNVLGLSRENKAFDRHSKALHLAILNWTVKNYAWLFLYSSRVAEACLPVDATYDQIYFKITKEYPAEGLRREAGYVHLDINPFYLQDMKQ
jgi:hypothetical protein